MSGYPYYKPHDDLTPEEVLEQGFHELPADAQEMIRALAEERHQTIGQRLREVLEEFYSKPEARHLFLDYLRAQIRPFGKDPHDTRETDEENDSTDASL